MISNLYPSITTFRGQGRDNKGKKARKNREHGELFLEERNFGLAL